MTASNVEKIRSLLKSIETGDPTAVAVVNEARYIQHNPQTHEGSEGLASLFERLSKTEPRVNMVRGYEDGDYVFAHMEYDFASRKICFEVFRFENGQAVEHWDNIQERLEPTQSGRTMVDGPIDATDTEFTETNRAIVSKFLEQVFVNGQTARFSEFIHAAVYAEHNPHMTDDLSVLRSLLARDDQGVRHLDYHRTHRVLAHGNFVLGVSEGMRNGVHTSFYDLYRLADGKIVEHWDTIEAIAPRNEWKNTNGKF